MNRINTLEKKTTRADEEPWRNFPKEQPVSQVLSLKISKIYGWPDIPKDGGER